MSTINQALIQHLREVEHLSEDELELIDIDQTATPFDANGGTYIIYTDEQADAECHQRITDNLCAVGSQILAEFTHLPKEAFSAIISRSPKMSTADANDVIIALIKGVDKELTDLTQKVIGLETRGSYLATYDHEEYPLDHPADLYLYRIG